MGDMTIKLWREREREREGEREREEMS